MPRTNAHTDGLCSFPTPHGDKLRSLLVNSKLPPSDRLKIERALVEYEGWLKRLHGLPYGDDFIVEQAVDLLNEYRFFLDIDIIFDSEYDFLYRQKGQLKLENSVIEEFLPHLVAHRFPFLCETSKLGPAQTFSRLYFEAGAGRNFSARLKSKDQDFAIYREVRVVVSTLDGRPLERLSTRIAYMCAECKTNLDKTMFQEAASTALDLKSAFPAAKYVILCEWLDMTPISTAGSAIDEVLILRKSRRLGANVRTHFASAEMRKAMRDIYVSHLVDNPFYPDVFKRFLLHVTELFSSEGKGRDRDSIIKRGYF